MPQLYTNNAISLLEFDIGPSSLQFQVAPGEGDLFPQPVNADDFFLVTFENSIGTQREIVKCHGRIGDTIFIDPFGRGFEDTPIQAWPVDTLVDHRLTAYTLNRLFSSVASAPDVPPVVYAQTSLNVDTFVAQTLVKTCKWLVTVMDLVNGRTSVTEVIAVYRGPTQDPFFTTFGKTGDPLHYHINVTQNSNTMSLTVVNDDTVDLTASILRIQAS